MAKIQDIIVRIRIDDRVTPVLRAIKWKLWWMEYAGPLVAAWILTLVMAFCVGVLVAP